MPQSKRRALLAALPLLPLAWRAALAAPAVTPTPATNSERFELHARFPSRHVAARDVRIWLPPERASMLARRRRLIAGPTGCGLCGIDSLAEAVRPARRVASSLAVTPADIEAALAALGDAQALGRETLADDVVVINTGAVAFAGTPAQLQANESVVHQHLGVF